MAIKKDFATIVREMENLYKLRLPQANLSNGAIIKEAFINVPASQLAFLYSSQAQADIAHRAATATGTDLDDLASNFNVVRNNGTSSTGIEYLILNDNFATGQDIVVSDGTVVSTRGQTSSDFKIVGQTTLVVSAASIYEAQANLRKSELARLGIVNARYLVGVPITALSPGTAGQVGVGTIVIATITGIKQVVNLEPTAGGTNAESDSSLRERLSLALVASSIGSKDAYKAAALDSPDITSAFVVGPGDPLMTRDGTIFDSNGDVIEIGSRRAVDVWVHGSRLLSNNESFVYSDITSDLEGPVAIENQKVLGYTQVTDTNPFALQPLDKITSVTGSESGSFVEAVEVEDDEGNILLEGNFSLLKDITASNYMIVRETLSGRLRVARQLDPFSTRYTLVQPLVTSGAANSAKGLDKFIFTSDRIVITNEQATRGPVFDGADALANTGVLNISDINEDFIVIKETIIVGTDHFNLILKHKPIISVQEVKHVRLGTLFSFSIVDANTGKIQISGKFTPQTNDIFEVSYTWQKTYFGNLEYFLVGDSVSWEKNIVDNDKRENSLLIDTQTLQVTNSLNKQPVVSSYLQTELSGIADRAKVTLTVRGDSSIIAQGEDSKVLESNEQIIVLQKGVVQGSVQLNSEPKNSSEIYIYRTNDVFRRDVVDRESAFNTFDSQTLTFQFQINTLLFDAFFSTTDNELTFTVSYQVEKPFTYEVNQTGEGRIGKVLRVRNLTKSIEYNLLNYNLRTNINDRQAIVNEFLTDKQFALNVVANQTIIDLGDKIKFKRLPSSLHWTSKEDFTNNVGDNLQPTINTSRIQIEESGNVRLKTVTERAVAQTTVQISGTISTDMAWSGSIEILDDVIVNPGVTLVLRPGTIVRVREKDRVGKRVKIEIQGRLIVDVGASIENPIIFTSAAATQNPGDWEGIIFTEQSRSLDSSTISNLTYVEIRYAVNAISVRGSNPRIKNCRLSKNLLRGLLYTAEPDTVTGLVLRDGYGDPVGWIAGAGSINETRIPLYDTDGNPIKLMSSSEQVPFGTTQIDVDGYGEHRRQMIHFTSSSYTQNTDVLNSESVTYKYKVVIGGVELDVHTYSGNVGTGWNGNKENAWIEYVGEEETFYLVLYKNTTGTTFTGIETIEFDYSAPKDSGLLYQNIIEDNIETGVSILSNNVLSIAGNTFYNNGPSNVDAKDCYVTIRNNLIQEYSIAPFVFDFRVMAHVRQNNTWSSIIEEETLNIPTGRVILASDIDAIQTTIDFVRNSNIEFRSGQIIQIGNEKIRVQGVTVKISYDTLTVTRGVRETLPASHTRGTTALVYGDRALFMVTGIPGNRCEIVPTDIVGNILSNQKSLQMIKKTDGTFVLASALNRSNDFRYRYRFLDPANNIVPIVSKMYTLNSKGTSIGDAAIDVFSPIHESFGFEQSNYAIDPLFADPINGNYEITSQSPSSKDNFLYAPEIFIFGKYEGRERVQEVKNFTAADITAAGITGITSLLVSNEVLIQTSARVDIQIFGPVGASLIYAFSFDTNSKIVSLDNATPITVAGTYLIQYYKPVNLGSILPGYNYIGELSYVVDAKQEVDFTDFVFSRNSFGGNTNFQFRSPDPTIENPAATDLATAAFGPVYTTSPIKLTDYREIQETPIHSQFLEIKIQLRGNWKGATSSGITVFPILEDMTLSFTSAADNQVYVVKQTKYLPSVDKTRLTITAENTNDVGITENTFAKVGSDERIDLQVYNVGIEDYESVAIATRLSLNSTTIEVIGDSTSVFPVPKSEDVYLVDYLWITNSDSEQLVFIEDLKQITEKRFVKVTSIIASILKDRQVVLPSEEKITVSSMNEPEAAVAYKVDYEYLAPKEGEVIETNYAYNDAIRNTSQLVQQNEDAIADVLVKENIEIALRIEAELGIVDGFVPADAKALAEVALSTYLDGFALGQATKIDSSDIILTLGNVNGVDSVKLIVFNKSPFSGVVDSIALGRNELPVLATGSPVFTTPQDTSNI